MTKEEILGVVKEARDEERRCYAAYFNCVMLDDESNNMLLRHGKLIDDLCNAIESYIGVESTSPIKWLDDILAKIKKQAEAGNEG